VIHALDHTDSARNSSRGRRFPARVSLLAVLAAMAVALLAPASSQAKVPKGFFSIAQELGLVASDYQQMGDIKVKNLRTLLNWKAIEPQRGVFKWGPIDQKVGFLAGNGMAPVFWMWGTPQWASGSGNPGVAPLKGSALQDWKTFVKTAVNRYKRGGVYWRAHPGLTPHPAKAWQIWNEPNLKKYFASSANPDRIVPHTGKAYGKFAKKTSKAINSADRHAKVVLAGLSATPPKKKLRANKFIKKVLGVKKITKKFDAAALHPYAPKVEKYKERISEFRHAMNKGGAKKKEIWLTEVGWGSKKDRHGLNKGTKGQAKILKKSFKQTLKKRKKWKIERLFWFDWRDPASSQPIGCSFCPSAGLLKHNGDHKPSYRKFKRFSKRYN
jgi:hypothetical protein